MAYLLLLPFYPKFLREKGIEPEYMGFVMSTFSACFIFAALLTGKLFLRYMSRIMGCYIGSMLIIASIVGLGSLYYITHKETIIILSFVFQMIGGFGKGMNNTCNLAILSSYKDKRQVFIAYF